MRRLCENFLRIDVRNVDFGRGEPWQYPPPSEIAMSVVDDSVHVIHRAADFYVSIEHTPCNYGGSRPWFVCPGCGNRRAVLYDSGHFFGCRRCMRLSYASETEDTFDRLERKRRKLEAQPAPDGGKPKWMRLATFERIHYQRAKARSDAVHWLTRKILG